MESFQFKQFTIQQDQCAMKVGTDGVLLGAWADGGQRILDIGTGTGLVALMMAQRFPTAKVVAVEVDKDAYCQASANVANSPFKSQVETCHDSIQHFASHRTDLNPFDSIVCNPPFFENSLKNADTKSSLARHNDQLSWTDLAESVDNLLSSDGTFSVILPIDGYERLIENLYIKGFKECRSCKILTKEGKPCKRILAAFTKDLARSPSTEQQTLLTPDGQRTEWYELLTKNFYIR